MWLKFGYIPARHGTLVMRKTKGLIRNWEVWLAAGKIIDKGESK
jgi:hypothetical protein